MRPFRLLLAALLLPFAVQASIFGQGTIQIHDVMTALPNSPYLGQQVSVIGIVAGVMSTGGFYLTARPGDYDANAATAEGIPIFNSMPCAVVGSLVTVTGTVSNLASNQSNSPGTNTPGTGITASSCIVPGVSATSNATTALPTNATVYGQLLPLTGIPVSTNVFSAISPTGGTLDEPSETVTSNGQFWAVVGTPPANNHIFRNAGIAADELIPPGSPAGIPTWNGNPRRLFIDSATFGGPPIDIGVGQSITCSNSGPNAPGIGLIDYTLGYNRLLLFASTRCTLSGAISPSVSAPADNLHFHVGSLNLQRFYNTQGNNLGAVAITPAAYARRLSKVAIAICQSLGQPDILALEEVQDLATLTDIANAANASCATQYAPYIAVGNDPNSLNLGFLVATNAVIVDFATQYNKAITYTTTSGATAPLWERPPYVLTAEFIRKGLNYKVSIINIQITTRGIEAIDDPIFGPNIRLQRGLQANDLSSIAQAIQSSGANLLIAGNFNAYSFNDGYVDVSNIVLGRPAAANTVVLYEPTAVTQPILNFESLIDNTTKYNTIENGNARSIEHHFVSQVNNATASAPLASYAAQVTQPHFTTDYPAITANDPTTAAGLTSHDGFVSSFLLPPVPTTASGSPSALDFGSLYVSQTSVPQTVTITNTTTFASVVTVSGVVLGGANPTDFAQTSNCTTLQQGQSCTVTLTFSPLATGPRAATLTVTTDSPTNPTFITNLTGTGRDTTATLAPQSADFGSLYAGQTATRTFTFTNTSGIAIPTGTATATAPFAVTATTCPASLAAGASCTYTVTFTAINPGALTFVSTGTLTISNGSSANPSVTAQLTGTDLPTTATLNPMSADFGSIYATQTATRTFTLTNTSGIAISIGTPTATGPAPAYTSFSVTGNTCPASLPANATCTITVAFTPSNGGVTYPGTLTVPNGSGANPILTAALTGTGTPTTATLTPNPYDFGGAYPTQTTFPTQTFTVTNTSGIPIGAGGGNRPVLLSPPFIIASTTCGAGFNLQPNASCTITVSFTPTAVGSFTGTLTVINDTNSNPILTATLTGTGTPTTATLTPTSSDFGSAYPSQILNPARPFLLTNTSGVPITTGIPSASGPFAVTANTCPATLAASAACTLTVTFAPIAAGPFTGTLTVPTGAYSNPTLTSVLTGTGLQTTAILAPTNLTFPTTVVGSNSATQQILFTNPNPVPLKIVSVASTVEFPILSTTCSGTIAATSTCVFNVAFSPASSKLRTGTFTLVSTSTANPTLTAQLSGTGIGNIDTNITTLPFGPYDVGFTSTAITVLLANHTSQPIGVPSIAVQGDYAFSSNCPTVLTGQQTCTIGVTFTPGAVGPRNGTLTINTNNAQTPVLTLALTGAGIDFAVSAPTPPSGDTIAAYTVYTGVTITPLGGFSKFLNLGCTSQAPGSYCRAYIDKPVFLSAPTDVTYRIDTTSQYTVVGYQSLLLPRTSRGWTLLLSALGLFMFLSLHRTTRTAARRHLARLHLTSPRAAALLLALVALALTASGCSGRLPDRNALPTPPGTYTYTLTATDGFLTRSATYTLTVRDH